MLSEGWFGEYQNTVLERRRISRYSDKQNYALVPSKLAEAGKEI